MRWDPLRTVVAMLFVAAGLAFPAAAAVAPATATAGGPGVGELDLEIMGMGFPGTVEHGQIRIGT